MNEQDVLAEPRRMADDSRSPGVPEHAGRARDGDFDALLAALDQDVVVRSNSTEVVRGAAAVAVRAFPFTRIAQVSLPAVINGTVGIITAADGKPVTLVGFTITGAKITAIDLIDNPRRIAEADLALSDPAWSRSW
jgi:RNA polymerase sigma-70 factor (ECF subfamily)